MNNELSELACWERLRGSFAKLSANTNTKPVKCSVEKGLKRDKYITSRRKAVSTGRAGWAFNTDYSLH